MRNDSKVACRSWRSCEKAENSMRRIRLNEFKRKDWGEEKNWSGGGGGGEEKDRRTLVDGKY